VTLLREIQAACTDPSVDTSNLLRKCKVLAARLGHEELAAWVRSELEGYPDEKSIPEYRRIKVQAVGHFDRGFGSHMQNAPIPALSLPQELRHFATDHAFGESISTLEANVKTAGGVIEGHWPADVVAFLQRYNPIYEGAVIVQAKQLIPTARIAAIVDAVRTRILDFVIAIEAKEPNAGDVQPGEAPKISSEALSVVYKTTIFGGAANIGTHGNASITTGKLEFSSAIAKKDRKKIEELLQSLRDATADVASPDREEAQQALTKVAEQLAAPEPRLPKIKGYLDLYATLVTVAAPTVKVLQEILPHVISVLG
jgi:AbiTii